MDCVCWLLTASQPYGCCFFAVDPGGKLYGLHFPNFTSRSPWLSPLSQNVTLQPDGTITGGNEHVARGGWRNIMVGRLCRLAVQNRASALLTVDNATSWCVASDGWLWCMARALGLLWAGQAAAAAPALARLLCA